MIYLIIFYDKYYAVLQYLLRTLVGIGNLLHVLRFVVKVHCQRQAAFCILEGISDGFIRSCCRIIMYIPGRKIRRIIIQ